MSERNVASLPDDQHPGDGKAADASPAIAVDPTLMSRSEPPEGEPPAPTPPSERPELVAGHVLGGRYRVERRVGVGGMGEVWSAEHVAIQMKVAVKLLLAGALQVPDIVARFGREARLLGRTCGDHLPHAIDFLVDDVYGPVLVTDFVEGESLANVLGAPMSVERAIDLGIDLAAGLAELHRARVVHRDLKPGNVILRPMADGRTRAVIIDLGVSRLVQESATVPPAGEEISTAEVVVGTMEYMAPEQILHCHEVTAAADVYALGALLFRAVAGSHVFGAGLDRMELARAKLTRTAPGLTTGRRDRVSRGLASVLACALERSPGARYRSAERMRADLLYLRELLADGSAPVTVVGNTRRPQAATTGTWHRPAALARRGIVTAATILTLLLGVVLGSRMGHGQPRVSSGDIAADPRTAVGATHLADATNRYASDPGRVPNAAVTPSRVGE